MRKCHLNSAAGTWVILSVGHVSPCHSNDWALASRRSCKHLLKSKLPSTSTIFTHCARLSCKRQLKSKLPSTSPLVFLANINSNASANIFFAFITCRSQTNSNLPPQYGQRPTATQHGQFECRCCRYGRRPRYNCQDCPVIRKSPTGVQ